MHSKSISFYRPRVLFFSRLRGRGAKSAFLTPVSVMFLNIAFIFAVFALVLFHLYVAINLSSAPLRLSKLQGERELLLNEVKKLEGAVREFESPKVLEEKAKMLGMVSVANYEFIGVGREAVAKK